MRIKKLKEDKVKGEVDRYQKGRENVEEEDGMS